jgi:hypothetical protein
MSPRWALRPAGLVMLTVAGVSGHVLAMTTVGHIRPSTALAYVLALLVFLCGSSGTALALLGPRLLDRVVVARRWLPRTARGRSRMEKGFPATSAGKP